MQNYIPHPSNGRLVGGVLRLRIDYGSAGYGVYWMLLELMRDAEGYRVQFNPKALAFAINEPDVALVERVTSDLSLFDVDDDGYLYSPWLNDQMAAYDTKKAKLQEAGRRGAARRYAAARKDDGQAIATPSVEDGQAIAILPNIMQPNKHDVTTPSGSDEDDWRAVCQSQGLKVDDELVAAITATQPEGHASGYVAQVCCRYGIGQNVLDYLLRVTDNASLSHPRYRTFCAIVRKMEQEKYTPKFPANFLCSKIQ